MLYKLEGKLTREVVATENATVEHILPQHPSDKWRSYLDEQQDTSFDLYVHRLGNLTLTKENSRLSNNLFDEKAEEYSESNYKLTRELVKYKKWTSKEIQARSVQLSEIAAEIWSLPSKYNEKKDQDSRSGVILSLDEDLELFNGTKPSTVMLFDNIRYVSSWNEAYAEIHKELYKAAPQVYEAFLKTEDNAKEQIISKEEASFTKAIELGENLFLNISFRNVKRMIRKLQIFVGFYSENTDVFGGDISEELIFEIA